MGGLFQYALDTLDKATDFPGAAVAKDWARWLIQGKGKKPFGPADRETMLAEQARSARTPEQARAVIDDLIGHKTGDPDIARLLKNMGVLSDFFQNSYATSRAGNLLLDPLGEGSEATISMSIGGQARWVDPALVLDSALGGVLQNERAQALFLRETDPMAMMPYLFEKDIDKSGNGESGRWWDAIVDTAAWPIVAAKDTLVGLITMPERIEEAIGWGAYHNVQNPYLRQQLAKRLYDYRLNFWDWDMTHERNARDFARSLEANTGLGTEQKIAEFQKHLENDRLGAAGVFADLIGKVVFDPLNLLPPTWIAKPLTIGAKAAVKAPSLGRLGRLVRLIGVTGREPTLKRAAIEAGITGGKWYGREAIGALLNMDELAYARNIAAQPPRGAMRVLFSQDPALFGHSAAGRVGILTSPLKKELFGDPDKIHSMIKTLQTGKPASKWIEESFPNLFEDPVLARFSAVAGDRLESLYRKGIEHFEESTLFKEAIAAGAEREVLTITESVFSQAVRQASEDAFTEMYRASSPLGKWLVGPHRNFLRWMRPSVALVTLSKPAFVWLNMVNNFFLFMWSSARHPLLAPELFAHSLFAEGRSVLPGGGRYTQKMLTVLNRSGLDAVDMEQFIARKTGVRDFITNLSKVDVAEMEPLAARNMLSMLAKQADQPIKHVIDRFNPLDAVLWPVHVASRLDAATRRATMVHGLHEQIHIATSPSRLAKTLIPGFTKALEERGVASDAARQLEGAYIDRVRRTWVGDLPLPAGFDKMGGGVLAQIAEDIARDAVAGNPTALLSPTEMMYAFAETKGLTGEALRFWTRDLAPVADEIAAIFDEELPEVLAGKRTLAQIRRRLSALADNYYGVHDVARQASRQPGMMRGEVTYTRALRLTDSAIKEDLVDHIAHAERLLRRDVPRFHDIAREWNEVAGDAVSGRMQKLHEIRQLYAEEARKATEAVKLADRKVVSRVQPAAGRPKDAPPGHIRLYRGQVSPSAESTLPEWVQEQRQMEGLDKITGRWFTDSLEKANWYLREAGATGELRYIDVPPIEVEQYRVSNLPEVQKFSKDPQSEFFLPDKLSKQSLLFEEAVLLPEEHIAISKAWDDYWELADTADKRVYEFVRNAVKKRGDSADLVDRWWAAWVETRQRHRQIITEAAQKGTDEAWAAAGEAVRTLYETNASNRPLIFGWTRNDMPRAMDLINDGGPLAVQVDEFTEYVGNELSRLWPEVRSGARKLEPGTASVIRELGRQAAKDWNAVRQIVVANARAKTDFVMLDYENQLGLDRAFQAFIPFEFWPTRQAWAWGVRASRAPGAFVGFMQAMMVPAEYAKQYGYPERLQFQIPLPMPFLDEMLNKTPVIKKLVGDADFGPIYWVDPMRFLFPYTDWMNKFEDEKKRSTPLGLALDWAENNTPVSLNPFATLLGANIGLLDKQAWGNRVFSGGPFGLGITPTARAVSRFVYDGDLDAIPEDEQYTYTEKGYFSIPVLGEIVGLEPNRFDTYRAERAVWALALRGELLPGKPREEQTRAAQEAVDTHKGVAWARAERAASSEWFLKSLTGWLGFPLGGVTGVQAGEEMWWQLKRAMSEYAEQGRLAEFFEKYPEFSIRSAVVKGLSDPKEKQQAIETALYYEDLERYVNAPFEAQVASIEGDLIKLRRTTQTEPVREAIDLLETQLRDIESDRTKRRDQIDFAYPNRDTVPSLNQPPRERALRGILDDWYAIEWQKDKETFEEFRARQRRYLDSFPPSGAEQALDSVGWSDLYQQWLLTRVSYNQKIERAVKDERWDDYDDLTQQREDALRALHEEAVKGLDRRTVERFLATQARAKTPEELEFERASDQFDIWMTLVGKGSPFTGREKAAISAYFRSLPEIQKHYTSSAFDLASLTFSQRVALLRRREIWSAFRSYNDPAIALDYLYSVLDELNQINAELGFPPATVADYRRPAPSLGLGDPLTSRIQMRLAAMRESGLANDPEVQRSPLDVAELSRLLAADPDDPSPMTGEDIDNLITPYSISQ